MQLDELNNLTSDILVARIEEQTWQNKIDTILAENPDYQEAIMGLERAKDDKRKLQDELMEKMRDNQLKSWKTESANFARAVRKSVVCDPAYKKRIENALKAGQEVEGWELRESEYVSIRFLK